jgi:crotonobetainyl-CoA:carnitine CoA-transferase CaiB-like acyl-CoA transferase
VTHRRELLEWMQPILRTRSTAQWIQLLQDKAVPCGPINTIAQAFADPQVQARGLRVSLPPTHPSAVPVDGIASPMRLSATPTVLRSAPPALGEHTDEVLRSLGLSTQKIAELKAQKVV